MAPEGGSQLINSLPFLFGLSLDKDIFRGEVAFVLRRVKEIV
jgi:hypothetical protein